MEKFVPFEKMSKRQQAEHRKQYRIMFGHQNCPISHKSVKDYNRKKSKENVKKLLTDYC